MLDIPNLTEGGIGQYGQYSFGYTADLKASSILSFQSSNHILDAPALERKIRQLSSYLQ